MLMARKEKAVTDGMCFDLMNVNPQLHHQYAFLRKADSELLLVVANFEDGDVEIDVTLPEHAFDYLEMKEKTVMAVDLLTKERQSMLLHKNVMVRMMVAGRSVRVWKIKV